MKNGLERSKRCGGTVRKPGSPEAQIAWVGGYVSFTDVTEVARERNRQIAEIFRSWT